MADEPPKDERRILICLWESVVIGRAEIRPNATPRFIHDAGFVLPGARFWAELPTVPKVDQEACGEQSPLTSGCA
jgi:hypothetical protein